MQRKREFRGGEISVLSMIRHGLIEVTGEQRPEGGEGVSHDNLWGKSRKSSECKCLGVGVTYLGNNKASIAEAEERGLKGGLHRASEGHCDDFEVIMLEEAASGPLHVLIPLPGMLFPLFFA